MKRTYARMTELRETSKLPRPVSKGELQIKRHLSLSQCMYSALQAQRDWNAGTRLLARAQSSYGGAETAPTRQAQRQSPQDRMFYQLFKQDFIFLRLQLAGLFFPLPSRKRDAILSHGRRRAEQQHAVTQATLPFLDSVLYASRRSRRVHGHKGAMLKSFRLQQAISANEETTTVSVLLARAMCVGTRPRCLF